MKYYFVMLNKPSGDITPLMSNGEMLIFKTLKEAEDIAEKNLIGSTFGYEVFLRGNGYEKKL